MGGLARAITYGRRPRPRKIINPVSPAPTTGPQPSGRPPPRSSTGCSPGVRVVPRRSANELHSRHHVEYPAAAVASPRNSNGFAGAKPGSPVTFRRRDRGARRSFSPTNRFRVSPFCGSRETVFQRARRTSTPMPPKSRGPRLRGRAERSVSTATTGQRNGRFAAAAGSRVRPALRPWRRISAAHRRRPQVGADPQGDRRVPGPGRWTPELASRDRRPQRAVTPGRQAGRCRAPCSRVGPRGTQRGPPLFVFTAYPRSRRNPAPRRRPSKPADGRGAALAPTPAIGRPTRLDRQPPIPRRSRSSRRSYPRSHDLTARCRNRRTVPSSAEGPASPVIAMPAPAEYRALDIPAPP